MFLNREHLAAFEW